MATAGRWEELLHRPFTRRVAAESAQPSSTTRAQRARHFMSVRNMRKAQQALNPPAPRATDYASDVDRLFPAEPQGDSRGCVDGANGPPVETVRAAAAAALAAEFETAADLEAAVWRSVSRMAPESQPGPSGLRPEHVKLAWALVPAFAASFTELIRRIIIGEFGGDAVAQSTLSLVPKPDGGARPIGVGELIRRVAGRIAMSIAAPPVRAALEAADQYALTQFGTALAYRRVAAAAATSSWVLQLDLRNAYNEVHRAAVLAAAPDSPILGPLISTLYRVPSAMFIPKLQRRLLVTRGVVQGCPLSSALFACALARITTAASAAAPVAQAWYADDGHVYAPSAAVLDTYLAAFQAAAARAGLTLSLGGTKTLLLAPLPLPAEAPVAAPALLRAVPVRDEIKVLGCPVLSAAVVDRAERLRAAWDALATKTVSVLNVFRDVLDPQHTTQLLAAAGAWSRVQYHAMVCADSPMPHEVAARLEQCERDVLAHALGPFGDDLRDAGSTGWLRATLPIGLGGLGLRPVGMIAAVARAHDSALMDAVATGRFTSIDAIQSARKAALLAAYEARRVFVRRLLGGSTPGALLAFRDMEADGASFLGLTASARDGSLLQPALAQVLLALLLGLRVLSDAQRCRTCRRSNDADPLGHHYAMCPTMATPRHDRTRDIIAHFLISRLPRGSVVMESGVDAAGAPVPSTDGTRPVDVGYYSTATQSWFHYDVVFSGVLAGAPHVPLAGHHALPQSLLAAHARSLKVAAQRAHGVTFVAPLAFGAFGGVDGATRRAIAAMQAVGADMSGTPVRPGYLLARLQLAIWRQLAIGVYRRRCADVPRDARAARPYRTSQRAPWSTQRFNLQYSPVVPPTPLTLASPSCAAPPAPPAASPSPRRPQAATRGPRTVGHAGSYIANACESLALMAAAVRAAPDALRRHRRRRCIEEFIHDAERRCGDTLAVSWTSIVDETFARLTPARMQAHALTFADLMDFPLPRDICQPLLADNSPPCDGPATRRGTRMPQSSLRTWIVVMTSNDVPAPLVSWIMRLHSRWVNTQSTSSSRSSRSSTSSPASGRCNPRGSRDSSSGTDHSRVALVARPPQTRRTLVRRLSRDPGAR